MYRSVAVALLLSSMAFTTVSARFFTLRLDLPSSSDHSSFSLCINQIGSSECSLFSSTQIPLNGSTIEMEFVSKTTRSSIQQHISFTSSIIASNFSNPLRRHSSHRLSINQLKTLSIAPGLDVNASLHCQQNYFGAACSIRCVSTHRISCDRSGRPSCANGWTGEGCATKISSTVVTTTVPSTTVTVSSPASSEVTVETRPHPDHTQLLIVLCMVLTVTTSVVVLYRMHQMSSVAPTLAAPDRLTTHLTTIDSTMEDDDSSVLFQAACNHLQSMQDLMVRSDTESVLDSSFVSALDEKTYMEMYP